MKNWLRAFLLAIITLPIVYGIKRNSGTFLVPFEQLLGITRADSSFLMGVWLITWAFSFLILGQLSQFIRCNVLFLMGMFTTALGLFMTSFAHSYTWLLIWFSIVSGLGFGSAWFFTYTTSIYDVYEKRGTTTGFNASAQTIGTAAFLVGLTWLIDNVLGFSWTFVALAIMILVSGFIGYFLVSKEKSKIVWFKFDTRLIRFYVCVSLVLGIWLMQMTHRLPLFKEMGMSVGWLGILALIELWVNAGTEPFTDWIFIDKWRKSRSAWTLAVLSLTASNVMLICLGRGVISFTLYAVSWGLLALLPMPIVAACNYLADYNKKDWGPLMGTTLFFANISMALFGWLGGAFYSWFGSYELILGITSFILLFCAAGLKKNA